MTRTPIPLVIEDVGPFARALRREMGLALPHQSAMNAVAWRGRRATETSSI